MTQDKVVAWAAVLTRDPTRDREIIRRALARLDELDQRATSAAELSVSERRISSTPQFGDENSGVIHCDR